MTVSGGANAVGARGCGGAVVCGRWPPTDKGGAELFAAGDGGLWGPDCDGHGWCVDV